MNPETILRNRRLSKTRKRIHILRVMMNSSDPLSGKEIGDRMAEPCDKSTVYRTLNTLYDNGMVQRIIIDHEVRYALKEQHQPDSSNESDHVHFKCSVCEKVFCMKDLVIEDYPLPKGFTKKENQFLIIGTCSACQNKNP